MNGNETSPVLASTNRPRRFDTDAFRLDVYEIVSQIPRGKVLSYGDVARLAGYPTYARQVGRLLSETSGDMRLQCHRVVNSAGRLSTVFPEQRSRLEAEGVIVVAGKVSMVQYRWRVDESAEVQSL